MTRSRIGTWKQALKTHLSTAAPFSTIKSQKTNKSLDMRRTYRWACCRQSQLVCKEKNRKVLMDGTAAQEIKH